MFICLYLRLKKENFFTADDNGLTLIHADEKKRDRNNSDGNRCDIICQLTVDACLFSAVTNYNLLITIIRLILIFVTANEWHQAVAEISELIRQLVDS